MRYAMKPEIERQLMRLLHGELRASEVAEWECRLADNADLAAEFARMREIWSGLDLPEPAAAGREFGAVFWERERQDRADSFLETWRLAPAWSRALAAAALAVGIAVGALVGGVGTTSVEEARFEGSEMSLAEDYWIRIADAAGEEP